jgi:hypothetical protein
MTSADLIYGGAGARRDGAHAGRCRRVFERSSIDVKRGAVAGARVIGLL